MRNSIRLAGILAILAVPPLVRADEPPLPKRTLPAPAPPVISTHHIDRYDAILQLQKNLKANPNSLGDWVILGELAHEVALDLPADQATNYARLSRQAYEKALALSPDNPGLKAAVQFARDQEMNTPKFEAARDRATEAYLEARRRDLAATNYSPSLRVIGSPVPSPVVPSTPVVPDPTPDSATVRTPVVVAPARALNPLPPDNLPVGAVRTVDPDAVATNTTGASIDAANMGTRQFYTAPTYRMYYVPEANPYTYDQFSSGYYVPSTGLNPALLPMTAQRYSQTLIPRTAPTAPVP
jgi:hypothetical protein